MICASLKVKILPGLAGLSQFFGIGISTSSQGKHMEKLLSDDLLTQLRQVFEKLIQPVQVSLFVSKNKQDVCDPIRQLLEEVILLSDKLAFSVYDIDAEPDLARLYKVEDKAPIILIAAKEGAQVIDYGIRYRGFPSGNEFGTIIQDLLLVSSRDSGLSTQLRTYLKALTKPLHLQVCGTPT
jgi:alkyl hydroperoxide reductase subunit AhpF